MKKIFILIISLILFTSNFTVLSYYDLTSVDQGSDRILLLHNNPANKVKSKTKLQTFLAKISNTPTKINATLDWVANRLDTILTKKGAIKTLLILGPLFTLYCYFFPPEPVKYLIKKIVKSSVSGGSELLVEVVNEFEENKAGVAEAITKFTQISGELHGIYEANKEIGIKKGSLSSFWNSWGEIILIQAGKAISYGITVGIPFVMGLYMKDYYIPTKYPVVSTTMPISEV